MSAGGNDIISDGGTTKPNPGTDPNTPLATFSAAVDRASKRKFVGNSSCHIYLKSDYTFKLNTGSNPGTVFANRVTFYHPDLTSGNKYFHIHGKETESSPQYTITIDYTGIADNSYYVNAIVANSNVQFHDLTIVANHATVPASKLNDSNGNYRKHGGYSETNDIRDMQCYADKLQFIYDATHAGTGISSGDVGNVVLDNVTISGFRWGFTGRGIVKDATFNNCSLCIMPIAGGQVSFGENCEVKTTGVCECFIS